MDPTPQHGSHAPGGSHRAADMDDELAADDLDLSADRDEIDVPDVTIDDDLVAERSALAVHLRPSAFPATAEVLVATALDQGAPPEIVERLWQLPPGRYHTVQEVWTALGGPTETRDAAASASGRQPGPAVAATPEPAAPPWVERLAERAGQIAETTVRVAVGVPVAFLTSMARRLRGAR
jgi:hypothetical protein